VDGTWRQPLLQRVGRPLTGLIAVEDECDPWTCEQLPHEVRPCVGPDERHGGEPPLTEREPIERPFGDEDRGATRRRLPPHQGLGAGQPEILPVGVASEGTTNEPDGLLVVQVRHHQSTSQMLLAISVYQPHTSGQMGRDTVSCQFREERSSRRVAKAMPPCGVGCDAPRYGVRLGMRLVEELLMIQRRGHGQACSLRLSPGGDRGATRWCLPPCLVQHARVRHRARYVETLDSLPEGGLFHPLDEVEDISVSMAAEAEEVVVAWIDEQAGTAVVVEGTAAHQHRAGAVEVDAVRDDDRGKGVCPLEEGQIDAFPLPHQVLTRRALAGLAAVR